MITIRLLFAWLTLLLATYVAAVGATTFVAQLSIGPVAPALLAGVAAVWLFARENHYGFVVAAGLGLLADLTASSCCGLSLGAFLVGGFIGTSLFRGWFFQTLPGRLAATLAFVWFVAQADAIAWLLRVTGEESSWHIIWQPAATAVYTTLLTLPVWFVLEWTNADEHMPHRVSRPHGEGIRVEG